MDDCQWLCRVGVCCAVEMILLGFVGGRIRFSGSFRAFFGAQVFFSLKDIDLQSPSVTLQLPSITLQLPSVAFNRCQPPLPAVSILWCMLHFQAQFVLPNGEAVEANETNSYNDLFWALRGGGVCCAPSWGLCAHVALCRIPLPHPREGGLVLDPPPPPLGFEA